MGGVNKEGVCFLSFKETDVSHGNKAVRGRRDVFHVLLSSGKIFTALRIPLARAIKEIPKVLDDYSHRKRRHQRCPESQSIPKAKLQDEQGYSSGHFTAKVQI